MHARQALRTRILIRSKSGLRSRTTSTAAALKPLPVGLAKWQTPKPERPRPTASRWEKADSEVLKMFQAEINSPKPDFEAPRGLSLGKWAKEAAQRPPTFNPKKGKGKWEKQDEGEEEGSTRQMLKEQRPRQQKEHGDASKPVARASSSETKTSKGKEPERFSSPSTTYESAFQHKGQSDNRSKRDQKGSFKSRGSLVSSVAQGHNAYASISRNSRSMERTLEASRKRKPKPKRINPDVMIPSIVSVGNLSRLLDVRLETLQNCMRRNGMGDISSYDHILSEDDASLLAMEFNRNPVIDDEAAFDICPSPSHPEYSSLPRRPPVVTIMGHVDHGKTTILDSLRSASVAKGEAGGITQHIGAFSVKVPGASQSSDTPDSITFLDTPGHAAFSAMRARGAQATDIIVLVVAADDGVMPQTKEVIELIKKDRDKVGVVVAINKVDKPSADVDRVQNALWAEGIELETMGGDVPSVEVSGLTGQGLEQLVETISLVAELQEIRAEPDGMAHGYVLESKKVKGFGNTATVLLRRGSLTPSSHVICGTTSAKVRQLLGSKGEIIRSAGPGTAVVVTGWKDLPAAGDEVLQGKEGDIKRALTNRKRKADLKATVSDAEAINASRRQERQDREKKVEEDGSFGGHGVVARASDTGPKELRILVKGDVSGSVEALAAALEGIGNNQAVIKVIHQSVGEVTESDIMLAHASEAMVVAFSVDVGKSADRMANQHGIHVYTSNIIYSVLDHVKDRVIDLLPKILEKRVCGEANVIQTFDIQGKGKSIVKVAGCRVSNGVIEKDKRVRVLRNSQIVHEGVLSTLRVLKRDVTEVKKGLECGMNLADFSDLRTGDFLQFYQEIEKPGIL